MLQQNDERSANLVQSDEEGVGRTERFPQVLPLAAQTNYATMAGREQLDDGVGNTFVLLWLQRGQLSKDGSSEEREINPDDVTF